MTTLRPYQRNALDQVNAHHEAGTRRVVCVVPTGGGKSIIGREWVSDHVARGHKVLMVAHRIELLKQFAGHASRGGIRSTIMAPGENYDPTAPLICASVDTINARGEMPRADAILWDECHHAVASTYSPVIESLPGASVLGLTATPQRGDGKPLGDLFDALVVGAQYSELLRDGHLVKCRVLRPEEHLGSDFARDPVEAWCDHARGKRGFIFARSVEESKRIAEGLNAQGIRAANVDGKMSAFERADRMKRFASGHLDVLTNVHVLTEGVDVPGAEVCMLARASQATGTYLQMVGRVLRPAPGKTTALLIDLPGASFVHGIPTADREYSLTGRSIKVTGESLRLCPECGNTQPSALRACEVCNYEWPRKKYEGPKIWNMALVEYIETAGDGTAASLADAPKDLKRAEWNRLLEVGRSRGFGASWAVKEWRKVFEGAEPHKDWLKEIGTEERVSELRKLHQVQRSRGLKLGWISHAYRAAFGAFPSRSLRESAGVPVPERDM